MWQKNAASTNSLKNKKVLITYGPTWIALDDMRVISNRSTGELGKTLTQDLKSAGAQITVLEGPVERPLALKGVRILKYHFFKELLALLKKELKKNFDIVIHAAAVSDYQPRRVHKTKIQSGLREWQLRLIPMPKMIDMIKKFSPQTFLVGFKMESADDSKKLCVSAVKLMQQANCDLVIANSLQAGYHGYIIDASRRIIAEAHSRAELSKQLLHVLKERR